LQNSTEQVDNFLWMMINDNSFKKIIKNVNMLS
jgi:hypothetical protein